MPATRLLFFGTPAFALPTLEALVESGRRPVRVITQPARRSGRGGRASEPPVAEWARARGLPVHQPRRVRDAAFLELARADAPDVVVVVAFGQIFPRQLLELPPLGCVNLHASLLPRHRGAAPVQAAIAAGDAETGVTTILMEEELDSGPILLQERVPIGPRETAGALGERLAALGARLMVDTLDRLEVGTLVPRAQRPEEATYAPRLSKEDGRVDWSLDAEALSARLRAYTPWPGLTAELRGRPVKIVAAEALAPPGEGSEARPGEVLGLEGGRLRVGCGGGSVLAVGELQRPGRRPLAAADFVNGERLRVGEIFR